jgi:hypothetical protein
MNPKLEQPNVDMLWNIKREQQAEMRREAQMAHALGGARPTWLARLIMALCVAAPMILLFVRVTAAAGAVGGASSTW